MPWQPGGKSFYRPPVMALRFRKSQVAIASVGGALAISALAYASKSWESLMLLGSFGASALLMFALPEGHLSQPRSVVGGHLTASAIALLFLYCFGPQWWAVGLATGVAIGVMMLTRTLHPPAGSNAIIIFLAKPSPLLLMGSTLAGSAGLVVLAMIYHRAVGRHKYPAYWRTASAT
jgi:CBS-domain-containing membrane protein